MKQEMLSIPDRNSFMPGSYKRLFTKPRPANKETKTVVLKNHFCYGYSTCYHPFVLFEIVKNLEFHLLSHPFFIAYLKPFLIIIYCRLLRILWHSKVMVTKKFEAYIEINIMNFVAYINI